MGGPWSLDEAVAGRCVKPGKRCKKKQGDKCCRGAKCKGGRCRLGAAGTCGRGQDACETPEDPPTCNGNLLCFCATDASGKTVCLDVSAVPPGFCPGGVECATNDDCEEGERCIDAGRCGCPAGQTMCLPLCAAP